jgi:hypothetical protein
VNAANPTGDTIQVCSGTYTENVVLAKSVMLLGAQAGVNACGRTAVESIVTPPLLSTTPTLELQSGSAGSIINGLTFFGGTGFFPAGIAIWSTSGPIDGLQLLNNRIRQFTDTGVFLNDPGVDITVHRNEIDGGSKIGGGQLFFLDGPDSFDGFHFTQNCVRNGATAAGFFVDGNRNVGASATRAPLFDSNVFTSNDVGMNIGRRAVEDATFSSNLFANNDFDGLQGGPKNSTITQNTFDSNGRHGLALTGFSTTPSADPTRGAQGNTVSQNCLTGNGFALGGAGIFFSATQFAGTISSNVANQNNIFGNFIGARYLATVPGTTDTETINAEFNWWGSPTGPTHPSNPGGTGDSVVDNGPLFPGGIDFANWLTSPQGGTPCFAVSAGKATGGGQVNVPNGRGSFGFNARFDGGPGSGHLNYINHFTGAHLDCTVTAVTMFTPPTAEFSGTCSANSDATSFMAHVEDNAKQGKNGDKFKITYTDQFGTHVDEGGPGPIISGNIEIHQ